MGNTRQTPEKLKAAASDGWQGISLDFVSDNNAAIGLFKAVAFHRSVNPPKLSSRSARWLSKCVCA
jgi:hypothetical protein